MLKDLTIALDMMGGDYGPRSSIPAAVHAVNVHANLTLILCGNEHVISKELESLDSLSHPRLIIRHCSEIVTNACEPSIAVRSKKDSSVQGSGTHRYRYLHDAGWRFSPQAPSPSNA